MPNESQVVKPIRRRPAAETAESQGFRSFVVTDGDGVALPGCTRVDEVRLGVHTIPEFEIRSVPTDATHKHFKDITVYHWVLDEGPTGVPTLYRGLSSNDGKWQIGATVSVRGVFSDSSANNANKRESKSAVPPVVTGAPELEQLTTKQLLALCAEAKIEATDKMSNMDIIALLKPVLSGS